MDRFRGIGQDGAHHRRFHDLCYQVTELYEQDKFRTSSGRFRMPTRHGRSPKDTED